MPPRGDAAGAGVKRAGGVGMATIRPGSLTIARTAGRSRVRAALGPTGSRFDSTLAGTIVTACGYLRFA